MEKYNYLEAVTADAKQWLIDNYEVDFIINAEDYDTFYDEMFISDSVTGNESGSYTFNTWKARENLCHNWDLMEEANNEIVGLKNVIITSDWKFGAKYWDVIIRCYLLRDAINNAIEEIKKRQKKIWNTIIRNVEDAKTQFLLNSKIRTKHMKCKCAKYRKNAYPNTDNMK